MIANSLLQPIYIANSLGVSDDILVYGKPEKIFAQVGDIKSLLLREDFGTVPNYDRAILVPMGEKTQYINAETRIWIDNNPNESASNMDYKIERVGKIVDGNLPLYLSSLIPNHRPLYYAFNGSILRVKVDLDNLVAIVPFNQYLPIGKATKVWLTEPSDINSTKNLVRLIRKDKLSNSYRLSFEKVV